MIPLVYILLFWIACVAIHGVLVFITAIQGIKNGVPGFFTYLTTFLFLSVIIAVVLGCGSYFLTVNWKDSVQVIPTTIGDFFQEEVSVVDTPLNE